MTLLGLRAAAAVLAPLPEPVVRRLGSSVARLVYPFAGARRSMLRRHMQRVSGDSRGVPALARRAYASYGRYWAETLWARPSRAEAILEHTALEGWEHVEAAGAAGRGMIFALPHLGSWDVAGLVASRRGLDLLAVAELPRSRELGAFFAARRAALGVHVARADGSRRTTQQLVRHLRSGGALVLLCDRDLTGDGAEVDFFGEKTLLPVGPAVLAIRTGAALLPAAAYFRPGRGHRLVVEPPLAVPTDRHPRLKIDDTTQALASSLESLVRTAPEQWHLLQPNWASDWALDRASDRASD